LTISTKEESVELTGLDGVKLMFNFVGLSSIQPSQDQHFT